MSKMLIIYFKQGLGVLQYFISIRGVMHKCDATVNSFCLRGYVHIVAKHVNLDLCINAWLFPNRIKRTDLTE